MLSDSSASGADVASTTAQNQTSLLYTGEQYDGAADQYYLRARYYNPLNGIFNRVDPYAGNMQDPQSLHKYAYVHNNPVNGIDPTGRSFVGAAMAVGVWMITHKLLIASILSAAVVIRGIYNHWRRDYGVYIGPEIGPWLYRYMRNVGKDAEASGSGYMNLKGRTWVTSGLKTSPTSNPDEVQSVQIFGQTVPADVGGNIMYGFIGRLTNQSLWRLIIFSRIGDARQKWPKGYFRTNEPEDEAATTFGYELAERYMKGDNLAINWTQLTSEQFYEEFSTSPYLATMTEPVQHLTAPATPFILTEPDRKN